jgi:glycosyltransferase involved in cell wall biosynthesis
MRSSIGNVSWFVTWRQHAVNRRRLALTSLIVLRADGSCAAAVPKRISAIIPTYNRRDRLAKVLSALADQAADLDQLEVVIIDDGSKDGTGDWVDCHRFPFDVQLIRQANRGPAHARNAGVDRATGTLILFLDDDVVPTPELVGEHLRSHDAERGVVVLGPLCSLGHYRQPWVAWEQAKLEAQYAAMINGDWAPSYRQFWTGNASVAREHVIAAGKFDPSYLRGEDVELGLRLTSFGIQFRFNPLARGFHHAERTLESWEHAHRSYGALEVRMWGGRGNDALVDFLAGNWGRMNPKGRLLVEGCVGNPARYALATNVLRRWLKISEKVNPPILTGQVLSAFANLLYWQASADALGASLTAEVRRRAKDYAAV